MAGKTRLAAERIHQLLPDAQLLVPQSGVALREVVDAGLELTDVVVWLNDLERFLRGENALDTALLDRLLHSRAVVVSTIRMSELEGYRPGNDAQPPEWEVIRRFERLTLRRGYTAGELARIRAEVTDLVVLSGIERYGLAEYLGAGPDAIEKFDDGETTCPIGHALVRAAVDWRRAGLANVVSLDDLREVLPSYLETRRDLAVDDDAVEDGLAWATKRINETVALMRQWRPVDSQAQMAHRLYEVFDYLVDVIAARPDTAIPAQLWIQVASRAAGSEAKDVARAANRYFTGRSRVIAQVASWLAAPATEPPHLLVVTGSPGSGKTAVLTQLFLLAAPATRELAQVDSLQPRLNVPNVDVMLNARGMDAELLMAEFCRATGTAVRPGSDIDETFEMLLPTLVKRNHPFVAVVDALDEAVDPGRVTRVISRLVQWSEGAPVRLLVSTRSFLLRELPGALIVDLDSPSYHADGDIVALVRQLLLVPGSPYCAEPTDIVYRVAEAVATRSSGSFFVAKYIAQTLAEDHQVVDVNTMSIPTNYWDVIKARLSRLGADEREATDLLRTLANGPPMGYSLEEWAVAASLRGGGPYIRQDIEDMLPLLNPFVTEQEFPIETRYRLYHEAIREYFLQP